MRSKVWALKADALAASIAGAYKQLFVVIGNWDKASADSDVKISARD